MDGRMQGEIGRVCMRCRGERGLLLPLLLAVDEFPGGKGVVLVDYLKSDPLSNFFLFLVHVLR